MVSIAFLALVAIAVAFALAWPLLLPSLTYYPTTLTEKAARPARHGLPAAEEVWLTTGDGVRIHGWWVPAETGASCDAAAIYFHGNAGSIVGRAGIAHALAVRGLDVLVFDYRGYGRSEGEPSEAGIRRDARAALRFVVDDRGMPTERVVLFGHSLGSAVATRLALDQPTGALVLGAPFPGLPLVVAAHAPWLPVRLLRWPDGRYEAGSAIAGLRSPLLVLTGENDRLVPAALSERVFARAPEPKRLVRIPAAHNTLIGHAGTWRAIDGFLAEHMGCGADRADRNP